jgi:hypothetical protein
VFYRSQKGEERDLGCCQAILAQLPPTLGFSLHPWISLHNHQPCDGCFCYIRLRKTGTYSTHMAIARIVFYPQIAFSYLKQQQVERLPLYGKGVVVFVANGGKFLHPKRLRRGPSTFHRKRLKDQHVEQARHKTCTTFPIGLRSSRWRLASQHDGDRP